MLRRGCVRYLGSCLAAVLAYFAIAFVAALALVEPAAAQKRVALIVGNSAYVNANALTNPANDAKDMAAALRELGIEVIVGLDLDKRGFDTKVRDFSRALAAGADTGIFFYAGHGLQVANCACRCRACHCCVARLRDGAARSRAPDDGAGSGNQYHLPRCVP